MTSIAITVKFGMNSLTMIDIILIAVTVIMLISYLTLLACKIEFFSTFTDKIKKPGQNGYKEVQNLRKKSLDR